MTAGRRRGLAFGLLVILAAEVLSQGVIASGDTSAHVLEPHPTRLWALAPCPPDTRVGYTAQDGLRASSVAGPEGAPLVLTLGDSSIFGHDVADANTIHEALQSALNANGVPVRVRTLAVPGYSTLQTRVVMDEVGWAMAPRVLVIGNLWSDSSLDAVRDADLQAAFRAPATRAEVVLAHSGLFRLARRAVNTARGLPAERTIGWPQPGDTGVRRVPLAQYVATLEAILDAAAQNDVGVIFLALATHGMSGRGRVATDPVYPYAEAQYRLARARGVPWLDMLTVYRASGRAADDLWSDGLHPTDAGATILGRALATELEETGFPRRVTVPMAAAPISVGADAWDGAAPLERMSVAGQLAAGEL